LSHKKSQKVTKEIYMRSKKKDAVARA